MKDAPSRAGGSDRAAASQSCLRALLLGYAEDERRALSSALQDDDGSTVVDAAANPTELRSVLSLGTWDVLLATSAGASSTLATSLRLVRELDPDLPVLLVGPRMGGPAAAAAAHAGAQAFVANDELGKLLPAIRHHMQEAARKRERRGRREARREAIRVSSFLVRAGRELIVPLEVDVLLDRLCNLLRDLSSYDSGHLFLRDPSTDLFSIRAGYGRRAGDDDELSIPHFALVPILNRLHDDEVSRIRAEEGDSIASSLFHRWFNARESLLAPLRHGGDVFGILVACSESEAGASDTDVRIFRGIARMGSLALENARLAGELARADRLKSEFVATMSHELRTPLNVIIGFTDLLLEKEFGRLSTEQGDVLRRVDRSAHELMDLINATLDLSRLEAGQLPLDIGPVSIATLVDDLRREITPLHADEPELRLEWLIASDLPSIQSDALKVRVVLKNLLINALKFTERGTVVVRVSGRQDGVEVSVTDTGIGIPAESMHVIFEPFRSGTATTKTGMGLGLYIVRRMLAELGGTIEVQSVPGAGSTFRVYLPNAIERDDRR